MAVVDAALSVVVVPPTAAAAGVAVTTSASTSSVRIELLDFSDIIYAPNSNSQYSLCNNK